eukprot:15443183-Alexandrium_andersonii.AAC.1
MLGPLQSIPELLDAPAEKNEPRLALEEPVSGSVSVPARGVAVSSSDLAEPGNAALRLRIPPLKSPEYYNVGNPFGYVDFGRARGAPTFPFNPMFM